MRTITYKNIQIFLKDDGRPVNPFDSSVTYNSLQNLFDDIDSLIEAEKRLNIRRNID